MAITDLASRTATLPFGNLPRFLERRKSWCLCQVWTAAAQVAAFQNALTAATTSQFHSTRVEKRQLGLSQSKGLRQRLVRVLTMNSTSTTFVSFGFWLIRLTIWLSVIAWLSRVFVEAASCSFAGRDRAIRWGWLIGALAAVAHVVAAMGIGHCWSLANAMRYTAMETRRVFGVELP